MKEESTLRGVCVPYGVRDANLVRQHQCTRCFPLLYGPPKVLTRGVHPSEAMMHFPPVSDFPPIFEKCSDSVENFQNVTFSRKMSRFSSAKISDDLFLVIDHKFRISLCFGTFPPCFAKIIISPLLSKMSPCFRIIHLLFTYFMCISFPPCFDHDAFMHQPMHVLDASGRLWY